MKYCGESIDISLFSILLSEISLLAPYMIWWNHACISFCVSERDIRSLKDSKIPRSQHVHSPEIYIRLFCIVDFVWAKRSLSQFQTVKSHLHWAGKQYKQQQCMLCVFISTDTKVVVDGFDFFVKNQQY